MWYNSFKFVTKSFKLSKKLAYFANLKIAIKQ